MGQPRIASLLWHTWLVLLVAAIVVANRPAGGAEGEAPPKKPATKQSHRLPPYYGSVVTDNQRKAIYRIQDEYQPKIAALTEQLKALKKERDEKIAAVLTENQKKRVEEAAKRKHESKKPQPEKPNQELPAPPVAEPKPAK
jgi:hypothetical protein